MNYSHAIVRPPGKSYARAINDWYANSHLTGVSIDWQKAVRQHAQYVDALRRAGLTVISLPSDEQFSDGCFVQDPAVVCRKKALITQQYAKSRRGEASTIKTALQKLGFSTYPMTSGFCDGGDVLIAEDLGIVWVGLSKRTDKKGFIWVKRLFEKYSYTVIPVPVTKCLHLMTGVCYLAGGIALMSELVDPEAKDRIGGHCKKIIYIPAADSYAVNVLQVGNVVIMPKGYPFVEKNITGEGYDVLAVSMSEFEKADGGVTCLSLLV